MKNFNEHLKSWVWGCVSDSENNREFEVSFDDFLRAYDTRDALRDCFCVALNARPEINLVKEIDDKVIAEKKDLVETRFYCPLKIEIDDGSEYPEEVCSENYVGYDDEINDFIRDDLNRDENAVERGLAAYLYDKNLDKKVHSIMPMVETRNGNLYGMAIVKSYGELDCAETHELTQYLIGQYADGYGESLEQHPITLGEDEVYISFWNSDDCYLKPESELFPEQEIKMGGISCRKK